MVTASPWRSLATKGRANDPDSYNEPDNNDSDDYTGPSVLNDHSDDALDMDENENGQERNEGDADEQTADIQAGGNTLKSRGLHQSLQLDKKMPLRAPTTFRIDRAMSNFHRGRSEQHQTICRPSSKSSCR
jgi:hypothetical protein